MKKMLVSLALVASAVPVIAADVGVSIHVDQPGVYGRIDIGRVPTPPVVIYQQPLVVMQSPIAVERRPIYLHVPPGHSKDWNRHCSRYQACGQPVYFVQDGWYRDVYSPVYHRPVAERWDKHDEKRYKEHLKYDKKMHKEQMKHEKKHRKHDKHDH